MQCREGVHVSPRQPVRTTLRACSSLTRVQVRNLEAPDGTPLLDVKPVLHHHNERLNDAPLREALEKTMGHCLRGHLGSPVDRRCCPDREAIAWPDPRTHAPWPGHRREHARGDAAVLPARRRALGPGRRRPTRQAVVAVDASDLACVGTGCLRAFHCRCHLGGARQSVLLVSTAHPGRTRPAT
jgi:hypothetical protein